MKKRYYAGIIISVIMILLAACCSFAQEFVSTLIVPGRTEFFDLAMDVNRRTKEL